jgi:hypothetical protein
MPKFDFTISTNNGIPTISFGNSSYTLQSPNQVSRVAEEMWKQNSHEMVIDMLQMLSKIPSLKPEYTSAAKSSIEHHQKLSEYRLPAEVPNKKPLLPFVPSDHIVIFSKTSKPQECLTAFTKRLKDGGYIVPAGLSVAKLTTGFQVSTETFLKEKHGANVSIVLRSAKNLKPSR